MRVFAYFHALPSLPSSSQASPFLHGLHFHWQHFLISVSGRRGPAALARDPRQPAFPKARAGRPRPSCPGAGAGATRRTPALCWATRASEGPASTPRLPRFQVQWPRHRGPGSALPLREPREVAPRFPATPACRPGGKRWEPSTAKPFEGS